MMQITTVRGLTLTNPAGDTFGALTVLRVVGHRQRRWYCECQCACGQVTVVQLNHLERGAQLSCGCVRAERFRARKTIHGFKRRGRAVREYSTWQGLKSRCNNPRNEKWSDYGGRGITVCPEWNSSFEAFYRDMGPKPSPQHSIDRIDNNGPYSPENCRWATALEQRHNQRPYRPMRPRKPQLTLVFKKPGPPKKERPSDRKPTPRRGPHIPLEKRVGKQIGRPAYIFLTHNGVTKSATEWARFLGMNKTAFNYRCQQGWTGDRLFSPKRNKGPKPTTPR